MMKCSICGTKCADIGKMGKHYRSKHPRVMARRKAEKSQKGTRKTLKMPKTQWNMIGRANGWL